MVKCTNLKPAESPSQLGSSLLGAGHQWASSSGQVTDDCLGSVDLSDLVQNVNCVLGTRPHVSFALGLGNGQKVAMAPVSAVHNGSQCRLAIVGTLCSEVHRAPLVFAVTAVCKLMELPRARVLDLISGPDCRSVSPILKLAVSFKGTG